MGADGSQSATSKGKARLAAYEKLVAEAAEATQRDSELQITIPANQRLGDQVIEVENIFKGIRRKPSYRRFIFLNTPPAGIVGVIGGNRLVKPHCFGCLSFASRTK